jgi:hypothetical protein
VEKICAIFTRYKKQIIFGAILFLTSSLSFGAGYLANREFNHAPIVIERCSDASLLSPVASATAPQ